MAELKTKKNNASVTQFLNFSPRAKNLTTYIMPGFSAYGKLLKKLGKHTTGKRFFWTSLPRALSGEM